MDTINKTHREYFNDTYKFTSISKLLNHETYNPEKPIPNVSSPLFSLTFEKTIFHPQGGGQPADVGQITSADGTITFKVIDLKCQGEIILHIGYYESEVHFEAGHELV